MSFAAGHGVSLDAATASLAAAHDVDLAAMRASLAETTSVGLEAVKDALAAVHGIDFDKLTWPEKPPDTAPGDADHLDGQDTTSTTAPTEAQSRAEGGTSSRAWRVRRAWDVLQVLLTVDNVLGEPGVMTLREAAGSAAQAAQEVLLFLWLVVIAQVPSPPPAPKAPVPEAFTPPSHVTEGSTKTAAGPAEREKVTMMETRYGGPVGDEEPGSQDRQR